MNLNEYQRAYIGNGAPIFRHKKHGILIGAEGEFGGENIHYEGFWTPKDWRYNQPAPYFLANGANKELFNYDGWEAINLKDLSFTGKYCKK